MVFIFSPRNGIANLSTSLVIDSESKETNVRRTISFEADFKTPSKVHLASGTVYNLKDHEQNAIYITIGEHGGNWERKDGGNPSFIGVGGGFTMRLILERARFDDVLQSMRAGLPIAFTIGPPNNISVQYKDQPPPIMLYEKNGLILPGEDIFWRDDISPIADVEYITYHIGLRTIEPEI